LTAVLVILGYLLIGITAELYSTSPFYIKITSILKAERSGEENYTVINNVRGEGPNLGRCLINIIKAEINVSFQWIKFPLDS